MAGTEGAPADVRAIRITGLAEAHAALASISADMGELSGALAQGARSIALRARLNVSSRTYRLAGSLTPLSTSLAAEVVTTSVYGAVQEYGWPSRNLAPQRFAARAVADGWPAVQGAIEEHCAGIIAKYGAAP